MDDGLKALFFRLRIHRAYKDPPVSYTGHAYVTKVPAIRKKERKSVDCFPTLRINSSECGGFPARVRHAPDGATVSLPATKNNHSRRTPATAADGAVSLCNNDWRGPPISGDFF
jgi:hypothetical protein